MPALCARTTRPATSAELAYLRAQAKDGASLGCLAVVALVALPSAATCFFVGERFGGAIGGALGFLASAIGAGAIARSLVKFSAPIRARIAQDLENGTVEVLKLSSVSPIDIPATHSSVDPAFAFELEGNRTLLLLGQWLSEPSTFGGDWKNVVDDDAGDAFANALPPPYSFPTDAFTLHRFAVSGEVVRIDLDGQYAKPREVPVHVDLREANDFPSRIVDGPPEDLSAALQRLRPR